MSENIPGIRASHYVITDNCRDGVSNEAVLEEALSRLTKDVLPSLAGWPRGKGTRFHIVVHVEPLSKKEKQDGKK